MKAARKKLFRSAGITVAVLLIWLLSKTFFSNWLIISFGVRVCHNIFFVETIILVICSIILAIRIGFYVKIVNAQKKASRQDEERRQEQERREAQLQKEYANDNASPGLTRRMLEEIRDGTVEMDTLVQECMNHMDTMNLLQKKQGILIRSNNASYLHETVEVLNRVETRLCQDIRSVINLCITTENIQADRETIDSFLRDAESRISDARQLLKLSGEWVNSYNEKDNRNDGGEVKLWIKTINQSLKEG